MLKSMTAFGRAHLKGSWGSFNVEIRSLNRRHLDINVNLPSLLLHYEVAVHEWVKERIERGAVTVRVEAAFEQTAPIEVVPNMALALEYKKAWEKLSSELDLSKEGVSQLLLTQKELFSLQSRDDFSGKELFKQAIAEALDDVEAAKSQEGSRLQSDIVLRLDKLKEALDRIRQLAPDIVPIYRDKLVKRLATLSVELDEERLLKEICLFADKIDIAEEITRFQCHLDFFRQLLGAAQPISAKKLEFLTQELLRETNTIASKSQHIGISQQVVEMKCELERIREQLQNVE